MLGVAAAAAAMLMAGCQEEKESPTLMLLAVNDTTMNVTAKVTRNTSWSIPRAAGKSLSKKLPTG